VDAAGDTLISDNVTLQEMEHALTIMSNWRSSHSYPLQVFYMNLRDRARILAPNSLVVQRLKRLTSLEEKLRRERLRPGGGMKLSRMHDIGGCRAVMLNVDQVDQLIEIYKEAREKSPHRGPEFVREYPYVESPKEDGYRSVHLVYKYRTRGQKHKAYNGLRIEIQLRSRLQHFWATAVEAVDAFTGRAIKSGIIRDDWNRFFVLMGSVIATKEARTNVPTAPQDRDDLVRELVEICQRLRIVDALRGMGAGIQHITEKTRKAKFFLVVLDLQQLRLRVRGYSGRQFRQATQEYLQTEKSYRGRTDIQVVLVSAASLRSFRRSYRNYSAEIPEFLGEVSAALVGSF